MDEDDEVLLCNLDLFLRKFNKNTPLGIYECPYPYKRLLSDRVVEYIRDTGRFLFFKDTCCDANTIKRRVALLKGANPMLFNANAETLPCTYGDGTRGYSGVHANISVKLVRAVMECARNDDYKDNGGYGLLMELNDYLSGSLYPVSAKQILKTAGIFDTINTRVADWEKFTPGMSKRGDELYERILNFEREYDKGNM
jgi:4-hydroxy-tetrahydrodipicolinate synthase